MSRRNGKPPVDKINAGNGEGRIIGGIPEKYFDLMKDVVKTERSVILDSRKLKRPRRFHTSTEEPASNEEEDDVVDDVDEDEMWEQVDLEESDESEESEELEESVNPTEILPTQQPEETLVLKFQKPEIKQAKRHVKILSRAEKQERLLIHKLHLVCLLRHVAIRNRWCNDQTIRKHYKRLLPSNILMELYPPSHLSLTLKTRKFLDGLRHAAMFWNNRFRIVNKSSRHGLVMLGWNQIYDRSRIIDRPVDLDRFKNNYLLRFKGNRDMAAQGFCALLRAVNVDVRLVASLQPLDFTSNTPMNEEGANQENVAGTSPDDHPSDIISSGFPVFWIEAWDRYGKNWVSVDAIVTENVDIVRRKSKLEPPMSDKYNILRYVVAYNYNGSAVDVTRRYANSFNAKTRKKRVTNTPGGVEWWTKALEPYKSGRATRREIQELQELDRKEANEDMPTSLEDFKGHPLFVLAQHLKRNEVLDPKVPCGNISLRGSIVNLYRRKDVKTLKSPQLWYRLGRVVKEGEVALKLQAPVTKKRKRKAFSDDEDEEEDAGVPLYADDQTVLYIPPPVVDGKVPRNRFKNIDVYCPSMVPSGAVHLPYAHINVAARLVGVDYADAVTGFDFQGRHSAHPRITGIVIAEEYEEAVMEVYNNLLEEQKEEDEKIAQGKALLRWRRYLIALRIKHRLNAQHGVVTDTDDEDNITGENIEGETHEVVDISDSPSEEGDAQFLSDSPLGVASPLNEEPELPVALNQGVEFTVAVSGEGEEERALQVAMEESLETMRNAESADIKDDQDPGRSKQSPIEFSDESGEFLAESMSESEL